MFDAGALSLDEDDWLSLPSRALTDELLTATRALHASGAETYRPLGHKMNHLVELHLALRDIAPRGGAAGYNTQAVHGTPITPKWLLAQLAGGSFCVSFFHPEQLDLVIPLLGPDSILILDNGAFSAWKQGLTMDDAYWDRFWAWALPVLDAIPQAVAVIPDVIGGTVEENRRQYVELPVAAWGREIQLMPVWHLNEPFSVLEDMMTAGYGRIAFGSAGAYRSVGTGLWRARVAEAFAFIDGLVGDGYNGYFRPRIHMMRGLGQLQVGEFPFDSGDSTNIALNHFRLKGTPDEASRVTVMRRRIETGAFPTAKSRMWPSCSWEATPMAVLPLSTRPLQGDLFVR